MTVHQSTSTTLEKSATKYADIIETAIRWVWKIAEFLGTTKVYG
jgi:hypothetical protein